MVAEVVPGGLAGAVEVDGPGGVVVEAVVELVAGEGAEDAGHLLGLGDAVVAPAHAVLVDDDGIRIGIDLEPAVRRRHGGGDGLEAEAVEVLDQGEAAGLAGLDVGGAAEDEVTAGAFVRGGGVEAGGGRGQGRVVDGWPVLAHEREDGLLDLLVQVRAVIDDLHAAAAQPLEMLRVDQGHLGVAVAMGDHVHADGAAEGVQEVDHGAELALGGVQARAGGGELSREDGTVDVPARRTVEALDHAGLPHGQQVDGVEGGGQGQGVLDHVPGRAEGADVDADDVAAGEPAAVGLVGDGAAQRVWHG